MLDSESKKKLIEQTRAARMRRRGVSRTKTDGAEQRNKNERDRLLRDVKLRNVLEALSESEEKFRTMFEFSPYSTVLLDLKGNIMECNQQFTSLHATSEGADAQVGKNVSEFFPEDQHPKLFTSIETVLAEGTSGGPTEYTMLREDGTTFLAEARSTVILDKQGQSRGLLAIARDITDSKQAEQALRESEKRYETVVENAGEGIVVVQDERLQYANPYVENVIGHKREEMVSRPFIEFIHPEDREQVMGIHRRRFRGEDIPLFYELRVIDKYGNRRWMENNGVLIEWNGRPATLNFLRDITEQKKTRMALRESEQKYRQLFETETDAIMIFDAETKRCIDVNNAAICLYGYSKEEFLSLTPCDISAEPDATEVYIKHAIEGFPGKIPLRHHKKKDGTVFPVEISGSSFMLNGRKVLFGVIRDITDHKLTERKILDNQAKLKSLASQLSRIEERERHRLATVLHDKIGQSLVLSKLKLDELRVSDQPGHISDAVEQVCASLDEAIQQTRTLTFDLSSPILYELGLEAAVAEWLTDEIKRKHGIETEFRDDGQEKPLDNDIRALLFRNVRELLVNVVKHAQANKVKVDIRRNGADICVIVEDNGIGFDPANVTAVAARSDKFGLFSIRERLEQLGGLIKIDSESGRGARILMKAPLKCETLTDGMEL